MTKYHLKKSLSSTSVTCFKNHSWRGCLNAVAFYVSVNTDLY